MVAQIDSTYWARYLRRVPVRLVSYIFFEGRPLTTKGQWINPFVFGHFYVEKKLPQMKGVISPIYITGTGRSGTTILGVMLSIHRQIGFLNEPKAMWHSFLKHEDVIGNYSRDHANFRLNASDVTDQVSRHAHKLYGAYSFFVSRSRILDKYPEVLFRVPFVRKIFPDAKFIFLTRNGWDACASITSWSKRNGEVRNGDVHDWWGVNQRKWMLMKSELIKPDPSLSSIHELVDTLSDHRLMAAVEWIVTMREGIRAANAHTDAIMTLRYESLVAAPRASLIDIFDFCNLEHDEDCFAYAEQVLKPVAPYPEFDMPESLRRLFYETMQLLGYDTNN